MYFLSKCGWQCVAPLAAVLAASIVLGTPNAAEAGEMRCIYLSKADKKATIAANLAKLDAEDRKLAEAQKYCPIHPDDLLGSMGVPVKIMLKGQAVFLC